MEITGIMHAHSAYSYDAKMSLPELKAMCQKNGIQFVCMTEHTDTLTPELAEDFVRECDKLCDETFRFVPGFEVPFEGAHVLMVGARTFVSQYASTIETLKKWTKHTPFVVLAHPVRNQFEISEHLLGEMHGLEVWNQQYEGKRAPRTRSLTLFETLRKQKPTLVATGGIDFHRASHFGAPFITINIPTLTEAHILEKMRMGAFRVHGTRASFQGVLSNVSVLKKKHRWVSAYSVFVIVCGKFANKALASLGFSFPKWLTQFVRKRV
jgi:predicted metal-dependent phosphoesterase TrpH